MTTRRKFVSGCIAASLTPSFAFASTNDPASDFDMKQYVNELNELVSIDSKSGHVEGANNRRHLRKTLQIDWLDGDDQRLCRKRKGINRN